MSGKSKISPGYKKTEIGIIPEDWEVKRLGDIGTITTGGTPPTSDKKYWNGKFLWATPTDIGERKVIKSTERKITDKGIKLVGLIPRNSLLVTCIASIGKNAILEQDGACNQQINAITSFKNYDVDFLYYVIEHYNNRLLEKAGQTATPIINKNEFSLLSFAFPSTLSEQRIIARVLSDIDRLIESLDKLIEKKKLIKKGTMQQLLTGKKRLPGFKGEWVRKRLGEVGIIKTGGTPPTSLKKLWRGDVIWVTPTDIDEHKEIRKTERTISEEGLKTVGELPPNTLLVTCIASIGKNAILKKRGACNQQINAILPSHDYDIDFLYYLVEFNAKKLLEKAGTTATPIISKNEFTQLLFAFPPTLEEQHAIAQILSDMDAEIEALEQKKKKYEKIKKGAMELLLTGKIRLKDHIKEVLA